MGEIPKYHFSHRFSELAVGELFTDLSLVCQGEQVIPCHRIVLAAHSQCLQSALADSCEMLLEDSAVMLPDFTFQEVHQLVQVMYGEVDTMAVNSSLLEALGMTLPRSPIKKKNVILKSRSVSVDAQLILGEGPEVEDDEEVEDLANGFNFSEVTVEKREEENISSRENITNMLTMKAIKKPKTKASMSFECPDCGSLFAALQTLYAHLEKCEKVDDSDNAKDGSASDQTLFKCSECGNVFDSIEQINSHMESTHFDGEHVNMNVSDGTDHDEVRLEEVEETIITVGGEGGITVESGDAVHMANVKTEQKYMCSICCGVYGTEEELNTHYQTHAEDEMAGKEEDLGGAGTEYDVRYMCNECNEVFDSIDQLEKHTKSCYMSSQAVRYQCNFCRDVFHTVSEHNEHTVQQHSQFITDQVNIHQNSNYFKCSRCSETFAVVRELTEHIIGNHQDDTGVKKYGRIGERKNGEETFGSFMELRSRCTYCLKTMLAKDELENHYKTVHPGLDYGIYMCSHCNKIFRSIEYLERHERVHQEIRPFQCGGCSAKFTLASTLHNHAKKCQSIPINAMNKILLPRKIVNPSPVYKCTFCEREFPNNLQMKQHMRESCGDRNKSKPIVRRILPKNDKLILPREGAIVMPHEGLTLGQLGNPNMNQSSNECVVQITLPDTEGIEEEESTTVILDSAGNVIEGDPSELDGTTTVLETNMDGTTTVLDGSAVLDEAAMLEGAAVLDGTGTVLTIPSGSEDAVLEEGMAVTDTVYAEVVNEVYVDYNESLGENRGKFGSKQGRKPPEKKDRPYRTKKEKAFNVKYGLDKERRFRCAMCTNAYLAKDHLIAHIRTHTGEKPFQCEKCKERFMYRSTWSNHRIRCIEGPEVQNKLRKFGCKYCSAMFFARDHRRCHERIHTGEKPWQCESCGEYFQYRNRWKTHTSRCDGTRETADPLASKKIKAKQSAKRGRYKCTQCDQTFNKANRLESHSSVHPGPKLHGCENCGSRFYNKVSLDEHIEVCTDLDTFKRDDIHLGVEGSEELIQQEVEEEIIDTFQEQVIECETVMDSNFETHTIETWIPATSQPSENKPSMEPKRRKRSRTTDTEVDTEKEDAEEVLPDIQTELDEIRRSPRRKMAKKKFEDMSYEERSVQVEKDTKNVASNGDDDDMEKEKLFCNVCDVTFDSGPQLDRHYSSRKHRSNIEESSSQWDEETNNI